MQQLPWKQQLCLRVAPQVFSNVLEQLPNQLMKLHSASINVSNSKHQKNEMCLALLIDQDQPSYLGLAKSHNIQQHNTKPQLN